MEGSLGERLPRVYMILRPIPVILIHQTFSLGTFLGVPDGPDSQEAILGSFVLQDEVRSGPSMGT